MGEYEDKLVKERYCIEGENYWLDVTNRIVNAICRTDAEKEVMRKLIYNKDFIPNSPTVMNAGTASGQLSACFVLPVEDSIDSIFSAVKNAAIIHKTGGGTGFSFSKLRPSGSTVKSTNGVASGVVSFLEVFDAATNAIKQGGKRRGANMGVLRYSHPEILDFIRCKNTEGKIKNFNLSVMVDDEFMKSVKDYIPGHTTTVRNELIFGKIIEGIYKNGEPGILFEDHINETNPTPEYGDLEATNPCGEQPLLPNESCNLGSINLANMVVNGNVDLERISIVARHATIFLDNVIDANNYPLDEIREATLRTRKIGLGVMGFHDMLLKLNIPYDSQEALTLAETIMGCINNVAFETSCDINYKKYVPKNSTRTTIAPTGTISIIAGVSSGIEPVFSWVYTRKDTTGERLVIHPIFDKMLTELCMTTPTLSTVKDKELYESVIEHVKETGTIQDIDWIPLSFKKLFKCALDIDYHTHIKMQATFQRHVDNAVSKTINMPSTASESDIADAIKFAWVNNCKGLTIYRTGSREEEVLCLSKKSDSINTTQNQKFTVVSDNIIDWVEEEFYESIVPAYIYKVRSGCGKFYVVVGHDGETPTTVFVEGDGTGGCAANMAALGRSVSTGLDGGISAESYVKQFGRVKCNTAMNSKVAAGKSCADIVGKCINNTVNRLACVIDQKLNASQPINVNSDVLEPKKEQCCDSPKFIMQEGCQVCMNCGKSRCS